MRGFLKLLAVCAAIVIGVYVGYLLVFPDVTLRYRLTVDVDVDGVTHTGSGVVEVFYQSLPDSLAGVGGGAQFGGKMRGYAITIDLGARGLLFVVNLSSHEASAKREPNDNANLSLLPFAAYDQPLSGRPSTMLNIARELKRKSGPVDVPLKKLPMIGRLEDVNESNSGFEELDPYNLAAAYGPGARITRAQFEITSGPISPMPDDWPAWLKADTNDHYTSAPHNLVHLGKSAFKGN